MKVKKLIKKIKKMANLEDVEMTDKLFEAKALHMQVLELTEHEDGSATVELEMNEATKLFLINYAVVDILSKQLDKFEEKFDA